MSGLRAFPRLTGLPVALAALLAATLLAGCGYMVGGAFPEEVRTIHVPIFTSEVFRRNVEFQLTEAVQKEIQNRSHFRLVQGPEADTVLRGRIVTARKDVLSETAFDDPRELQLSLNVEVTWEDLRTGQVLSQQMIPIPADIVPLATQSSFAPEVGHSYATAVQAAVDRMAEQIVDRMETPW